MIYNLGSINADYIYRVPHLPAPGETLAAEGLTRDLGGKGANQSVAAALAGSSVRHIGAVGADGAWTVEALEEYGVVSSDIMRVDTPTAHAIINVDASGENAIVLFAGANRQLSLAQLETALSDASPEDSLLLQNETNLQAVAAELARSRGMKVIYSAAPFDEQAVTEVLPWVDILVMNAVEASAIGQTPRCQMIITRGAQGADWIADGQTIHSPAFAVTPVDTTGAGDCFIGYAAAGLDQGLSLQEALRLGSAAAALQVTKPGTSRAIPTRADVELFLS